MSNLSNNLKVLIWKNKGELSNKTYREYIDHVANRCQMVSERLRGILLDVYEATSQEEGLLRDFFADYGYDLSAMRYEFIFEDLLRASQSELVIKNIQYLLSSIEWGENAEFVNVLGVNPSTVSRWKQGVTKPDKDSQLRICRFFGYHDVNVLTTELLFLGLEPVSLQQKKQQCKKLIDDMGKEEFERFYPAILKLLN